MPGLNASGHQCLNGIGGRRHEGAAREDKFTKEDLKEALKEASKRIFKKMLFNELLQEVF